MHVLSVNFMGRQHEKTGDQNFPKDFFCLKNLAFLHELSKSSTSIARKACSPAELYIGVSPVSLPLSLEAEEEILVQKKPLQSPLLLVCGAPHILRDSLSSLSLRWGQEHIRILVLLSLELGVVTPGWSGDDFWHNDRQIRSKKFKPAWAVAKVEPFQMHEIPAIPRNLWCTRSLGSYSLHTTPSAALGSLTFEQGSPSLFATGAVPWNQPSVTTKKTQKTPKPTK